MDEKQTQDAIPMEFNVPAITASLEMLTVDANCTSSTENKRVLRKRIAKPRPVSLEIPNRRCSLKPRKRTFMDMNSLEESVKEYYLDKSLKKKPNNLETIYEESDNASNNSICMSAKRFKRMLLFKPEPTTSKLKKRRAKIQKVFGSKVYHNKKRISMQTLLDKLDGIRINSPGKIDNEFKR